jgi:putative membrane protein
MNRATRGTITYFQQHVCPESPEQTLRAASVLRKKEISVNRIRGWTIVGALALMAGGAWGQTARQESKAMQELARANLAEIATGKLAAGKAQGEEVRKFAQQMVDEHLRQFGELQKLARAKGIELPKDAGEKRLLGTKKLEAAAAEEFDRLYLEQMVGNHQKVLKLAQTAAKRAQDPELKAAAQELVPQIRNQLEMAQRVSAHAAAR